MISCIFHQPALRRHLDDGAELSARARSHLRDCPKCREMLAAHRAIIGHLSARRTQSVDTPTFLHARIMNNLDAQPRPTSRFRWITAAASVGVIAAIAFVLIPQRPTPQQPVAWPNLPTRIAFKTSIPQNPLQTEIENLRADTLNAAKALAASFLPDPESK